MTNMNTGDYMVNRVKGYNWAIKSIAWGKRVAPESLQNLAGRVADKVGGAVIKIWPDYMIGISRLKANQYNYTIHGIDTSAKSEAQVKIQKITSNIDLGIIDLKLGQHPIDRKLDEKINEWAKIETYNSEYIVDVITEWIKNEVNPNPLWLSVKGKGKPFDLLLSIVCELKARIHSNKSLSNDKPETFKVEVNSLVDYYRIWNKLMDFAVWSGSMDVETQNEKKAYKWWLHSPEEKVWHAEWGKITERERMKIISQVIFGDAEPIEGGK